MPRYRLSAKPLPPGAAGYVVDFQEEGVNRGTPNWSPLLDAVATTPVEFDLVHARDVTVRMRVKDSLGFVGTKVKYRTIKADLPQADEVPEPETIETSQEGPTLTVEVATPAGYEAEVRVSEAAVVAPHDALPSGTIGGDGCCTAAAVVPPDATAMNVHARLVRTADRRRGPWLTVEAPVVESGEWGSVEDHAADFSGGTIGQQGGKDTFEELSVGIAPLRLPRAYNSANDAKAYNSTTNVRKAYAPHPFPTRCVYEGPEIVMDAPVDFRIQAFPETEIERASIKAYSPTNRFPTRLPMVVQRGLEDPEAYYRSMSCRRRETKAYADSSGSPDRAPVDVTQEVSLSQDGSTWGAYRTIRPDEDIVAKGIRPRLVVVPPHVGGGITIPRWTVRRRRRNRKHEYLIPFDYVSGDDGLLDFAFDDAPVFIAPASRVVVLGVDDALANVEADYSLKHSFTPDGLKVRVSMRQRGVVTTSGGSATWNYPTEFLAGTTPDVVATAEGSSGLANVDMATPGNTAVTVYAKDIDSLGTIDANVHIEAIGIPPTTGRVLHVVLTGY